MDLALGIAVAAAAANLMVAVLHLALPRELRGRIVRVSALIALTAALYNGLSAVFCVTGFSDSVYLTAGRLAYLVGAIHILLWIVYAYSGPEVSLRKLPGALQGLVALISGASLEAAAAGGLLKPQISVVELSWPRVSYHYPVNSTAGDIYALAGLALLIPVFWRLLSRYGRGEWNLRLHLACFGLFFVCALEHLLVIKGLLRFLSLIDFGLMLAVMPLWWQTFGRIIDDRRRPDQPGTLGKDDVSRSARERDGAANELAANRRSSDVVASLNAVVWEADPITLEFTFVSAAAESLLGYPLEAWRLGKDFWARHLHPEDRDTTMAAVRQVLTSRKRISLEYRMLAADGRIRRLRDFIHMVGGTNGLADRLCGIMVDVTDDRHTDQTQLESERRFRTLFEQIPLAAYRSTPQGRILMANPALLRLLGYESFDELAELNLENVPVGPGKSRALFRNRIESEEVVTGLESEWRRRDGSIIFVRESARAVRNPEGKVLFYDGIVEDFTERRSVEQAWGVSETRFQQVAENACVFVWEMNATGLYTYVSSSVEKMLGYAPAELVGKLHYYDLFAPPFRDELKFTAEETFRRRAKFEMFANPVVTSDGRFVLLEKTGVPLIDPDGNLAGYRGSDRDVTERKRDEAALRESRATILGQLHEIEAIYAAAPVGLCVMDADLRFQRINDRLAEMNGLPADQHLGRTISEVLPNLAPFIEPVYRQVLETGKPVIDLEIHGDTPAVPGAERVFLASFFPLRASEDRYAGINVVVQDITNRKRAEAALAESENRFRSMADSAPVIIWLSDGVGTITFVNKRALLFTGRTEEELYERKWLELIHREDLGRATAMASAALDRRGSGQLELRLRRADGRDRWMLATAIPRFTGAEFAGYIGTLVDITELKEEQERLLANQKLESLGVLAQGIAHDFNNLLANIVANTDVVSVEIGEGSAADEGLERIRHAAIRASDIVSKLLAYAGQEKSEFTSLDLARLIGEMPQILGASISKNAKLEFEIAGDLPPVQANAAQIRQVLTNLVTNASEALRSRPGVIRVCACRAAPVTASDAIADLNAAADEYVRLEVSDSGDGMSEEVCSRIFDPFFTTKFPGRGLGLAAVQGIVRLHGGTIQVASAPGSGTRIGVLLRVAGAASRDSGEAPLTATATADTAASSRVVLMIEDEEALRSAVCRMLRKTGFAVLEAQDGAAAVEALRATDRDIAVVLLDLALPGLSGREVLAEIRRLRPGVKVIVTTAYSLEIATTTLHGDNGWRFIRKPYRVAELISVLRQSLD